MASPPIPRRSDQRSSIIWREDTLDYKTLAMTLSPEITKKSSNDTLPINDSDPYELYLSSEEDASISDNDSEYLFDSDDSELDGSTEHSRAAAQKSQEITARAISFRVVGRPQIIEINSHSTSSQVSLFPAGLKMKTDPSSKKMPNMKPLSPLSLGGNLLGEERPQSSMSSHSLTLSSSPLSQNSSTTPSIHSNLSFYEELALFSTELSQPWMPLTPSFSICEVDKSMNQELQPSSPGLLSTSHAPKVTARSSSRSAVAALKRVSRSIRNTSVHVPKISLAYTPGVASPRSPSYQGKNLSPPSTPEYDKPLPHVADMADRSAEHRIEGISSPINHATPKNRSERRISLGYSKKLK